MTNVEIAELLRNVAASYQLRDEKTNKFKIIAYQRAADAIEHASSELKDLWDEGKLDEVPGVGPPIAKHLDEVFKTGKSKHFEQVMKGLPPKMFELMALPGIGPKTAYKMMKEGDIPEETKEALKKLKSVPKRHLLPYASVVASEVIAWMKKDTNVVKIDPLGSLRRQASTIGDIDISVDTNNPVEVLTHFTKFPKVQKVLEKGVRTASIVIPGNIQVDIMAESPEGYGSLLQHFTGSKHHNIALRELALKKGFSLSDYGVKKAGDSSISGNGKTGKLTKFKTEEELYKFFGLGFIPPEIREDSGEIEAAKNHKLPKLVELSDIKGDLQIHSDFDIETSHDVGLSTMEEIVTKAKSINYEYVAFTDHNPSQSGHSESQIVELLKRKREKVDELNYSISKEDKSGVFKVFNSLEIDIMPDGNLPVPPSGFDTLDFALVSVHSSFRLPKAEMTKRVLSALSNPKCKVFAHPTARKLQEREGIELNWPEIFDFCLKNDKWIEINCDPMRLDLPDNLVKEAVKLGVKLTFGTDAHHKDGLNNMIWGVSVARRGWAEKNDIINSRTLNEFENLLNHR
jgi:DNA polymerase (family 10)